QRPLLHGAGLVGPAGRVHPDRPLHRVPGRRRAGRGAARHAVQAAVLPAGLGDARRGDRPAVSREPRLRPHPRLGPGLAVPAGPGGHADHDLRHQPGRRHAACQRRRGVLSADEAGPCAERGTARPEGAEVSADEAGPCAERGTARPEGAEVSADEAGPCAERGTARPEGAEVSADEAGPCAERGTARPEGAEVIAEFAFRVAHARADRSRVRRTLIPVVIATTIVGAVIAAASVANAALPAVQAAEVAPVHAAPGAPDVVVYGDSLAWEASDAVVAAAARAGLRAQVTSFGGLALC